MKKTLRLLAMPDKRPVSEAIIWYKDGLALIRKQLGGWATYMLVSILLLLLAVTIIDLVVALLVQTVPAFSRLGLLVLIVSSSWVILSLQAGMYRSMARVVSGGKVSVEDFFWGFGQLKNQQFWFFVFFMSLFNLGYQWLEGQLVGEIYHFDANNAGHIQFNEEKIGLFFALNTVYWLFLSALTWAILPMMTEFSTQKFVDTFKRNLSGTLINIRVLLYLGALMMLSIFVFAGLVVILSTILHPAIGLAFMLMLTFLGVPLFNAWQFSAYRHIFTDW